MNASNPTLIDAALRLAELGYPVFPCVPGGKVPLTEHGYLDATTDPATIEAWWTREPRANIGLATSGLFVVDVDGMENTWPPDREQALDLATGPVSLTPHGGRHHVFREPDGKTWRNTAGKLAPKVDTRARGGYIVVPPSVVDGTPYRWIESLGLVDPPERLPVPPPWLQDLLDRDGGNGLAGPPPAAGNPIPSGQRNATLARLAGTMRRVGMGAAEIRAAILETNAARCQPPLSVSEVDRIAASIGRYEPDQIAVALVEDHFGQDWGQADTGESSEQPYDPGPPPVPDPGPVPEDLLQVPGFIHEVIDYNLETAPYPNPVLAFAGAVALQAFLAGRKVRDPGDNRSNLYLLGLAHSAAGKDWPRKVNMRILHGIGLSHCVGERFASGEGIQDVLAINPCMLFQTDEIDGILQQIHHARDGRHENIMSTLLTLYSASNMVLPMRCKAGKEPPGTIDQPCLVLFGTAIPQHYYEALSERMMTNGFFARTLVLESGKRARGQEPRCRPVPSRVMETASWWGAFRPGPGNLEAWHPEPAIVEPTEAARTLLADTRAEADDRYAEAEANGDAVGTTVWGRVGEQTRKLALVYAVSEDHLTPRITEDAVRWASRLVLHQTQRMLFMASEHVAETPFQSECLRVLRKLRDAPDQHLAHSVLLKRMKVDARMFQHIITTLEQRGDVVTETRQTLGRPGRFYHLGKPGGEASRAKGTYASG